MYCKNCGKEVDNKAMVCPQCGVATDNFDKATAPATVKKESNTIGLVGFILSFFNSIAGLICSIIGYKKAKELGGEGKGFSTAGIVISSVSLGLGLIALIIYIIVLAVVISASIGAASGEVVDSTLTAVISLL